MNPTPPVIRTCLLMNLTLPTRRTCAPTVGLGNGGATKRGRGRASEPRRVARKFRLELEPRNHGQAEQSLRRLRCRPRTGVYGKTKARTRKTDGAAVERITTGSPPSQAEVRRSGR